MLLNEGLRKVNTAMPSGKMKGSGAVVIACIGIDRILGQQPLGCIKYTTAACMEQRCPATTTSFIWFKLQIIHHKTCNFQLVVLAHMVKKCELVIVCVFVG